MLPAIAPLPQTVPQCLCPGISLLMPNPLYQ